MEPALSTELVLIHIPLLRILPIGMYSTLKFYPADTSHHHSLWDIHAIYSSPLDTFQNVALSNSFSLMQLVC